MDFHGEFEEERRPERGSERRNEILGILLTTAGVLCLAALLMTDSVGIAGRFIKDRLMMVIGGGAFFPSLFLVGLGISLLLNKRFDNALLRGTGFFLFFLVFVVSIHLPLPERSAISAGLEGKGGGVLGAFLSTLLLDAFGVTGTYLLLVSFTLISLILMIEVPLVLAITISFKRMIGGLVAFFYAIGRIFQGIGRWFMRMVERGMSFFPDDPGDDGSGPLEEGSFGYTRRGKKDHNVKEREGEAARNKGRRKRKEDGESVIPRRGGSREGERKKAGKEEGAGGLPVEQLRLIEPKSDYSLPPLSILNAPVTSKSKGEDAEQSQLLVETLSNFGINVKVVEVTRGPVVTRYEVQPAPGVKVSRIVNLADDLALSLAAPDIRIEAPIPGKSVIGIEVPNRTSTTVYAREVLDSPKFRNARSPLVIALGKDIAGEIIVADLRDMVHLLVAGATGSGKSVCMNMIISSIIFKASPDVVKFIMVDPKVVELSIYNGIPHLLSPVVTDPRKAALTLGWVVKEMDRRYRLFAEAKARNIESYNRWALSMMMMEDEEGHHKEDDEGFEGEGEPLGEADGAKPEFLPYIVVIIDELADLMMVAPGEVEDAICRLAQKARAAGIHLVLATQRPSTDVITGLIKANIPSRIAFAVSSAVDSRIILDSSGAERLLGKGDMLFHPMGASKMTRIQGAFITDREVERLVEFLKGQSEPRYESAIEDEVGVGSNEALHDDLFEEAVEMVLQSGQASASLLQRRFRIGYTRAARLIDMMEEEGIVGPHEGSKPRAILITEDEWKERKGAEIR